MGREVAVVISEGNNERLLVGAMSKSDSNNFNQTSIMFVTSDRTDGAMRPVTHGPLLRVLVK